MKQDRFVEQPHPSPPRLYSLIFIGLAILALGVLLFFLWDQEAFLEWKRNAGVWPFFIALTILPVLGIPTTPFFMVAGAVFDLATAFVGTALSLVVNLSLCYWLAHRFLKQPIIKLLKKYRYEMPTFAENRAIQFILLVRITPGLPFFLKNYATALVGVSFLPYLIISWITTFIYAIAFIILGESLIHHDIGHGIWAVALLGLVVMGPWLLRRQQKQRTSTCEPANIHPK
jgi:uncharacterized membrane protein YdjX (TVP38/TMEM64 family)